jgi:NAD(P)-dependent dehydrogenase (short-subunit alcohol dehydrogenase family)
MNPLTPTRSGVHNKVVLVTGASRGIGRHLVERLAADGAQVVFCARSAGPIHDLAARMEAAGHPTASMVCDITREDEVAQLMALTLSRFGRLDVLVNNVGIAGPTLPIEATPLDGWNQTIAASLTGSFLCLRAAIPHLRAAGGGSVINIGSIAGKRALVNRIAYASAKMGVIGFTRTAAAELGRDKIRVNCICPGAVAGERLDEVMGAQGARQGLSLDQAREAAHALSPLHTLVQPEDVAEMVVFLSSDASRHMTGQDINVSAGVVMY